MRLGTVPLHLWREGNGGECKYHHCNGTGKAWDDKQQHYVNHGHPDGDIMTSLMAYHWFSETREYHATRNRDHRAAWREELPSCKKVVLLHHVMHSIWESVSLGRQRGM